MVFSQKIIELRKEKGLTQKAFADKIGTTDKVVWTYERGKCEPSLAMLKQIAEVFGVSVGYLVGAEDEDGRAIPTDLSQKDKDLLKAFHKLGPFEQETVMIQISALAEKVNV